MPYIAYVPTGPLTSYVKACPVERGLEYTLSLTDALRFESPEAIDAYLAERPTAVPVQGGTGTPPFTVEG